MRDLLQKLSGSLSDSTMVTDPNAEYQASPESVDVSDKPIVSGP